jgi:hypothetical protein
VGDAEGFGEDLELTALREAVFGAGGGVVGHEKLDDELAGVLDAGGVGADDHAGLARADAGGGEDAGAFDLDGADAADRHGGHVGVVAEDGDYGPRLAGGLPDRGPLRNRHLAAVDGELDEVGHGACLLSQITSRTLPMIPGLAVETAATTARSRPPSAEIGLRLDDLLRGREQGYG